mgnify:CR=1 FL=1
MREIKFKAVAINTGEWVYSTTISKGTIKRKRNDYFFEVGENKWTGVIDGIDIYEGDILHYEGITSFGEQIKEIVSYSTERAQFMSGINPMNMYTVTPKIVGNKYAPILTKN